MSSVRLHIHTRAAAVGLPSRTANFTLTGSTDEASLADFSTFSAVGSVRLNIHTSPIAIGLPLGTGDLTFSVGTNLPVTTSVVALTAVFTIVLVVHTLFVANGLTGKTRDDTLAALTDFTVFAGGVALSTVTSLGLKVVACSPALRLTGGTGNRTGSISTNFTRLALGTASATVLSVIGGVDTHTVAIGLIFRTGCLHTLALVTIMLGWAIFDLGAELKAASCVLDANLVLTGNLGGLGGTLERSVLALCVGTIGNTLVLFALFKVFANSPTFTSSPDTTFALLGTFHTSFAVGRKTTL